MTTVTVVLPTHRRPDALARALTGLAHQQEPGVPWDVVVVDNEPAPGAEDTFARHRSVLPPGSRMAREAQVGACAARNRGIAEATGDIVAFLDDDVVPARDWLTQLVRPLVEGRAEAVGGRAVLDPSVPRPAWFDEDGIGAYLTSFHPSPVERYLTGDEYVITANAAFLARTLAEIGGFDSRLGPRGDVHIVNDDVLLSRRLLEAGGRLLYVPAAVVVHELPAQRLRPRWLLRRAHAQGRSDWIIDADLMARGRFAGAGCAVRTLGVEASRRCDEGLLRSEVSFHLACDAVRAAGWLREALRYGWDRTRQGSAGPLAGQSNDR